MMASVSSGSDLDTPGRGTSLADGDEVDRPFMLLDEYIDHEGASTGVDSSYPVGSHHPGHRCCSPLGIVALTQRLELGLVIVKVVQDRRARMGLFKRKEDRLVVFVLTSKGIFELEDDVVNVEVSEVGHDIESRCSG